MQIHRKCLASNQIVLSQLYNCCMLMQKHNLYTFFHTLLKSVEVQSVEVHRATQKIQTDCG